MLLELTPAIILKIYDRMLSLPSSPHCVDTGHSAEPHRAASTAVFRDPGSLSSCFRRSLSTLVFWSNKSQSLCVSPSVGSTGRMPLVAGVSRQGKAIIHPRLLLSLHEWRKRRRSRGGSALKISPATPRPVDCVADDEITVTK